MIFAWLLGAGLALAAGPAPDAVPPGATSDVPTTLAQHLARHEAAVRAERDQRFGDAVTACQEAIRLLPDGPRSRRCADRLTHLEARRDADGGFDGWATLETVRAQWRHVDPEASRATVLALTTTEGISETVRAEALVWLAADALDRRGDPDAALAATKALYADRGDLEPAVWRGLVGVHARALAALGRYEEALAAEDEIRIDAPAPRPTPVERLQWADTRVQLTKGAWGLLAAFGILVGGWTLWARPPRVTPLGLVPLIVGGGATWLLAERWSHGAGDAIPWMVLGWSIVHLLTAPAQRAATSAMGRGVLGVGAALATLAVAWVALFHTATLPWVWL